MPSHRAGDPIEPTPGPPPGWYLDPGGQQVLRWWDGRQWGPQTQPLPGLTQESQPPRPDATAAGTSGYGAFPSQQGDAGQQGQRGGPRTGAAHATGPQGPQPPQHGKPGASHWVRNILTLIGGLVVAGIIISALSGGGSSGSSSPSADSAGSPSSSPSSICTTNACIASDAEGLKGTVAKDNSVMTKVTCRASTVKQVVSGTYTVDCAVTYSDGSVWDGIASVLTGSGDIDWEPTSMVSAGNSGD